MREGKNQDTCQALQHRPPASLSSQAATNERTPASAASCSRLSSTGTRFHQIALSRLCDNDDSLFTPQILLTSLFFWPGWLPHETHTSARSLSPVAISRRCSIIVRKTPSTALFHLARKFGSAARFIYTCSVSRFSPPSLSLPPFHTTAARFIYTCPVSRFSPPSPPSLSQAPTPLAR
jgi:hypothetical protein